MAPRRKSARIAQKPAQPQSSYRVDSISPDPDDDPASKAPFPPSDDGESDVYNTEGQHTDSDSDDNGHDELAGSVADDLDLGGRESTKRSSGRNKARTGSGAAKDTRSWMDRRRDERAQRYPDFRNAAWVLAHPPRKAFKRDKTLERSWMNRRLPFTFKNNNTRMKTTDGIELFTKRPTVDGPASPPSKGSKKGGRVSKKATASKRSSTAASNANRTKRYGDWANPEHGINELNMPPDFLKFLWDDGLPGETPKEPLAIEDRQVVRCDENFGLHDHANDDAAHPDGFTCCESRKSHLDMFMKQRREEMMSEKQQDNEAKAREQQQEQEQGIDDEQQQQKSDSTDNEESDEGDDEDSDDARSNKKKKAAKRAKRAKAQKARRSSARWGPSLRIKDGSSGTGVSVSDRVLLGEVYEWEAHDFAICAACDDQQTAHIESEASAKAQDGLFHGALVPLCQACALHAADTLGHGYNGCRCDSERRCLAHRAAHLEELADAREQYVGAHQPNEPADHPALRLYDEEFREDGDADAGYPQVSPMCPHCRTNFPPPVPAHFAYVCVRCDEEVVLPAPEDKHDFAEKWLGVGEEPQAFVKNLPRPVKGSLHLLEERWDWNADWVDVFTRYTDNPLPEDEDDEAAVVAASAAGAEDEDAEQELIDSDVAVDVAQQGWSHEDDDDDKDDAAASDVDQLMADNDDEDVDDDGLTAEEEYHLNLAGAMHPAVAVASAPAPDTTSSTPTAGGEQQAIIASTATPSLHTANTKRKRAPAAAAAESASSSASSTTDDDNDDEHQRGLKHARVAYDRQRVTSTTYSAGNSNNAEAGSNGGDEDEDLVDSQGSTFSDTESSMFSSDAVDEYDDDDDNHDGCQSMQGGQTDDGEDEEL
ncbi:hypothetical protein SLS58_006475 [Diplodia intermedia]|uniref:Uncharacterized protein n=1 Tax=Diplodia intermedia TaxID=856260 RepID=A0ABR3TML6_9PEZI